MTITLDALTIYGLCAVSAMLLCDMFERKNKWFTLAFGFACFGGSTYGFLQGAVPFGVLEGVWGVMKFYQFWERLREATPPGSQ